MKVLLVHNSYQQPGGEDQVFQSEFDLLRANGHEVTAYQESNDGIVRGSIRLAANSIWNQRHYRRLLGILQSVAPDVVHLHNTFPQISPAVYYAARKRGAAVVQTLHNYRLLCPSATLFRAGKPCESCLGKGLAWPGIKHACYRGSIGATATVSAMVSIHKLVGTWSSQVDRYIALSEFTKALFVRAGFPAEKVSVKSNFVEPDPAFSAEPGQRAVFVGRLTHEKGISTLLESWRSVDVRLPLDIIGDGPLAPMAAHAAVNIPGVRWLKWLPREEVFNALRKAYIAIVPSVWYEPFGMIVPEAFAIGVPVVASANGGLQTMISPGVTGLLFQPGDASDLTTKVLWALEHPDEIAGMRVHARKEFELRYTAAANYTRLMNIYQDALQSCKKGKQARAAIAESRIASVTNQTPGG